MKHSVYCFAAVAAIMLTATACHNDTGPTSSIDPVAALYADREIIPNIRYSNIDPSLLLDAYIPSHYLGQPPWHDAVKERRPTLLYLHGGGFISGDKISRSLFLMSYVSRGWCVITADYRLAGKSNVTLPGMYSDARAALNWIYNNADKYKMDTTKIIVSGESAGGALSLMTGLRPNDPADTFGRQLKVAGIINWFGPSDLRRQIPGKSSQFDSLMFGRAHNVDSMLQVCSPVTYITASSPPVMTIHGDQDPLVPYNQSVLLQDTLNKYGVKNDLFTVKGKKHGNFDAQEMTAIFDRIYAFLDGIGVESPLPRIR